MMGDANSGSSARYGDAANSAVGGSPQQPEAIHSAQGAPLAVGQTDGADQLANQVLTRVSSDDPHALISHTHQVLFEEEGFQGNQENYFDPANSYIPRVLETKLGIPITLTLIYKEVLDRVGLSVTGTNAPGHFLASVWLDGRPMIVDPFAGGRVLSRAEAYDLIERLVGRTNRTEDLLQPATNHGWITRILHNLQVVFGQSRQQAALGAMLELNSLLSSDGQAS